MRTMTIEFRGVYLECQFHYEPAGIGGDWDERLPASVDIEAVNIGDCDVLTLFSDQAIEQLEARLLEEVQSRRLAA